MHLASAVAAYERGMQAVDRGEASYAITAFQEALRIQSNFLDAQIALGHALLEVADYAGAVAVLEKAHRQAPQHPTVLGTLGMAYLEGEHRDEGGAFLVSAVKHTPDLPEHVGLTIAELLQAYQRAENAYTVLTLLAERYPASPALHTQLATTLFEMADESGAQAHIEQALRNDASWAPALHLRGIIALKHKDLEAALQAFVRVQELDPLSARADAFVAVTLLQMGRQTMALRLVQASLELHEQLDSDCLIMFAEIFAANAKYRDAIRLLKDLLRATPDDDDAIAMMLDVAKNVKDRKALQWMREEIAVGDAALLRAIADCERAITPAPKKRRDH
jgi:tetratricopeptide (TPR) repeat protein